MGAWCEPLAWVDASRLPGFGCFFSREVPVSTGILGRFVLLCSLFLEVSDELMSGAMWRGRRLACENLVGETKPRSETEEEENTLDGMKLGRPVVKSPFCRRGVGLSAPTPKAGCVGCVMSRGVRLDPTLLAPPLAPLFGRFPHRKPPTPAAQLHTGHRLHLTVRCPVHCTASALPGAAP